MYSLHIYGNHRADLVAGGHSHHHRARMVVSHETALCYNPAGIAVCSSGIVFPAEVTGTTNLLSRGFLSRSEYTPTSQARRCTVAGRPACAVCGTLTERAPVTGRAFAHTGTRQLADILRDKAGSKTQDEW